MLSGFPIGRKKIRPDHGMTLTTRLLLKSNQWNDTGTSDITKFNRFWKSPKWIESGESVDHRQTCYFLTVAAELDELRRICQDIITIEREPHSGVLSSLVIPCLCSSKNVAAGRRPLTSVTVRCLST